MPERACEAQGQERGAGGGEPRMVTAPNWKQPGLPSGVRGVRGLPPSKPPAEGGQVLEEKALTARVVGVTSRWEQVVSERPLTWSTVERAHRSRTPWPAQLQAR